MQSIQLTPKWSRIARLSLTLVTVAGAISTHAQPTDSVRYTVTDLGPVGAGQPFAITVADSLWGDQRVSFQKPFLTTLATDYGAGFRYPVSSQADMALGRVTENFILPSDGA